MVITNKGREMLLRGGKYKFSVIKTSEFDYEGSNLEDIEELVSVNQVAEISKSFITDNTTMEIFADVSNKDLGKEYYIKTIGIYVKSDDDDEFLYAVATESKNPDYMPKMDNTITNIHYQFMIGVINSDDFSMTVVDDRFVTNIQLEFELNDKCRPNNEMIIINHNSDYYPVVTVLEVKLGAGKGKVGEMIDCHGVSTFTRTKYINKNEILILVPCELNLNSPTLTKLNDNEYIVNFLNSEKSLQILLK